MKPRRKRAIEEAVHLMCTLSLPQHLYVDVSWICDDLIVQVRNKGACSTLTLGHLYWIGADKEVPIATSDALHAFLLSYRARMP